MEKNQIARATLGRLPLYLEYLKQREAEGKVRVSAPNIARDLGRGEVQVRKDLSAVSKAGRPKLGYHTHSLINDIELVLGPRDRQNAVIVGAGRLGRALMEFEGFDVYGLDIPAAFDIAQKEEEITDSGKKILPLDRLVDFCRANNVRIGIITVPAGEAQSVCDLLVESGVAAIWNFAPEIVSIPNGIALRQENLALSLAHLNTKIDANSGAKK